MLLATLLVFTSTGCSSHNHDSDTGDSVSDEAVFEMDFYQYHNVGFGIPSGWQEEIKSDSDGKMTVYYYSPDKAEHIVFIYSNAFQRATESGKDLNMASIYTLLNNVSAENEKMAFNANYLSSEIKLANDIPAILFSYDQYADDSHSESSYQVSVEAVVFPVEMNGFAEIAYSYDKNHKSSGMINMLSGTINVPEYSYNYQDYDADEIELSAVKELVNGKFMPEKDMIEFLVKNGYSEEEAKTYLDKIPVDYNDCAKKTAVSLIQENIYSQKQMEEKLMEVGYTKEQAQMGASEDNIDYNELAYEAVLIFWDISEMDTDEMRTRLLDGGFSEAQADYALGKFEQNKDNLDDSDRTIKTWYW